MKSIENTLDFFDDDAPSKDSSNIKSSTQSSSFYTFSASLLDQQQKNPLPDLIKEDSLSKSSISNDELTVVETAPSKLNPVIQEENEEKNSIKSEPICEISTNIRSCTPSTGTSSPRQKNESESFDTNEDILDTNTSITSSICSSNPVEAPKSPQHVSLLPTPTPSAGLPTQASSQAAKTGKPTVHAHLPAGVVTSIFDDGYGSTASLKNATNESCSSIDAMDDMTSELSISSSSSMKPKQQKTTVVNKDVINLVNENEEILVKPTSFGDSVIKITNEVNDTLTGSSTAASTPSTVTEFDYRPPSYDILGKQPKPAEKIDSVLPADSPVSVESEKLPVIEPEIISLSETESILDKTTVEDPKIVASVAQDEIAPESIEAQVLNIDSNHEEPPMVSSTPIITEVKSEIDESENQVKEPFVLSIETERELTIDSKQEPISLKEQSNVIISVSESQKVEPSTETVQHIELEKDLKEDHEVIVNNQIEQQIDAIVQNQVENVRQAEEQKMVPSTVDISKVTESTESQEEQIAEEAKQESVSEQIKQESIQEPEVVQEQEQLNITKVEEAVDKTNLNENVQVEEPEVINDSSNADILSIINEINQDMTINNETVYQTEQETKKAEEIVTIKDEKQESDTAHQMIKDEDVQSAKVEEKLYKYQEQKKNQLLISSKLL